MKPVIADMVPAGMETFLSQFGIKRHRHGEGKFVWTIDVVVEDASAQTQMAQFDEQIGIWKVHGSQGDEPSSARKTEKDAVANREHNATSLATNWTDAFPSSAHSQVLLNLDWGATSLGPLQTWPRSLQLYTQMLLSDFRPAVIYWGPERIAIYNEAVIPLIGNMHPTLMGRSFEQAVPTSWSYFGPLIHALEKGEHGFARSGLELPTVRFGYLEESWWDGGLIALRDECADYGGTYFSWTETTRTILRDRRTRIINRLGLSSLSSTPSFWQHVYNVFQDHSRDFPMAVMYSTDEDYPSNGRLHREYTIGVEDTCTEAPLELDLTSSDESTMFVSLLRRVQEIPTDFLVIDLVEEQLDATIFRNVVWQGFGEPSRYMAVVSLRDKLLTKGYLFFGLNPRRPLDEDHEQFVTEIARQLNETMIRATFRQNLQDREKVLTTELSESEKRASRLAEIVPVGIYELAADGSLRWANSQFFEIMGVPHGHRQKENFAWTDHIKAEDHDRANEKMGKCLLEGVDITDSLRLRRSWQPPGLDSDTQATVEPFWVMYSASPNFDANGAVYSLTGSITDISHLIWAEQLQARNAEAAQRERRIQEEFIDITSHEMRNPLSAITQSADGILLSLQDAQAIGNVEGLRRIIDLNAEAAESILFCAAHQRRIIDDILTLGKLDSKLLTISPVEFHLEELLDQALKMFKSEFEVNKIHVRTVVEVIPIDSMQDTPTIKAFIGDTSRLLQVLVNLMTNAIKFTKAQTLRNISIRCGSSYGPPATHLFGNTFQWYCTGVTRPDVTEDPEYGPGGPIFLHFAITDSGEGIPPDALERIFTKFEQADRRTHTKYGGSGLGLYISRELTELQGGCIGIESAVGVGSTFAFYTKARHADIRPPGKGIKEDDHQLRPETAGIYEPCRSNSDHVSKIAVPRSTYNILVVEDNVLNQTVLEKQLRRARCNVQTSNHGGEAVDIILQKYGQPTRYNTAPPDDTLPYFDCILMDWEMPVCDGVQATRLIRSIEEQQGAARSLIIGITANARPEQIKKARDAGMDEVVPKPFRVAELLAKIGSLTINP
ncbi:hypothetical protein OPT61_g2085 [Boeremia exigua]|uniref:Uncharacterized protein n=1 Tax=Boeremia exigua TaxID=749465 RepID=A0ACC2IMZ8_9PLEO|nr:hypothetical protein OPT61_g2085 [Boeremia exigua]